MVSCLEPEGVEADLQPHQGEDVHGQVQTVANNPNKEY